MTDTTQTAWMREYERLMRRLQSVMAGGSILNPLIDDARADIDAHVRGLVEENERLRRELREIAGWCESHGHPESRAPNATTETQRNWAFTVIAEMGKRARNALATPKDAS